MVHGVLRVYKEKGYTSHDVVGKLRGIFKQKKIGHTGTLDPDAEGVLPICLGSATKICDMLTDSDKTYEAVCKLGIVTDTQDISGKILENNDVELVTEDMIRNKVTSFLGEYEQIPPMYSALKVNGKKLYEYAREGVEIERKPRKVTIYDIVLKDVDFERQEFTMQVFCSKGTYIRTLCHDIGKALGCGACMKSLLRVRAAGFELSECKKLSEISEMVENGTVEEFLIPVDEMFLAYPAFCTFTEEGNKRLFNGNILLKKHLKRKDADGSKNSLGRKEEPVWKDSDGKREKSVSKGSDGKQGKIELESSAKKQEDAELERSDGKQEKSVSKGSDGKQEKSVSKSSDGKQCESEKNWFRIYDKDGIFQAVYEEKNGQLRPVKTFFQ